MKRKFSKILGVGLTLALLTSLLLTAAPVSAVTTPVVTLAEKDVNNPAGEISKLNEYTILFTTGAKVLGGEDIVVVFEAGTNITAITATDVLIDCSAGLGGTFTPGNPATAVVTGTYPAAQTLTITPHASTIIGAGAIVQLTIGVTNYVTNPDTAGTYNLTVATSQEAAVTSADYTIKVPTIVGLPGVASVYNPVGVLMAQKNSLSAAITAAGVDYTIQVGPGTYTASIIDISHNGLTFVSTDGAAITIIDTTGKSGYAVTVSGDEAVFDGFTVTTDDVGAVLVTGADAIVQNNVMTAAAGYPEGIRLASTCTGATVSGNELDIYNTMMVMDASDCTLSDNIFGAGINLQGNTDITITGNTLIGSEFNGILLQSGVFNNILIEDNTISETTLGTVEGVGINIKAAVTSVSGIQIIGNDLTDNKGDGIRIAEWNVDSVIKFNTITGNEDDGIDNDSGVAVDAALNWWGTAGASVEGTVTTDPFLADTAEAVLSASDVAANAESLNAKTTVGVAVSGVDPVTTISVAKYTANPQEDIADALAFYDVYVAGGLATDEVSIKFYAGDENTEVYLWSVDTEIWVAVTPVGFSAYGGYVWVTVDADLLAGTPFALVGVTPAAGVLAAPAIISPDAGEKDVDLRPTFAWTAIADVIGYEFELADNPNFVAPLMKLSGELGRLIVPFYQYMPQLDYSKAYYWRVRAVDAVTESAWSGGVFITVAEVIPEPEPEPVWTCPQCGLDFATRDALAAHAATAHPAEEPPEIIVEPDVEVIVPLPAETPITPGWIYVIIAVGAVLVIAMIVLIIRTRRVA